MQKQVAMPVSAKSVYVFECFDRAGRLKWREEIENIVVTAGLNDLLDKTFKASGEILPKAASLTTDGTDGKMEVVLTAAELDEAGRWSIQARFTLGSYTGPTERESFIVTEGI